MIRERFGVTYLIIMSSIREMRISHIPKNARGALNPMNEVLASKIKNVLSDKFQ